MPRFKQVKGLTDLNTLRAYVETLGVEIPIDDEIDPSGALAAPMTITDGSAGRTVVANRFTVLPMEGWDGLADGRPSELVKRRWRRFGQSGAGLVWGEATAVRHDGKANPNQLVLDETTVDDIAELRTLLDPSQVTVMQLTHSGRYARPTTEGPEPRTLYKHPFLDDRDDIDSSTLLSDDEIDELVQHFIASAVLAEQAGFDFVDVKACHGYLGHEFLSAQDRPGRYGGDLESRSNFLSSVIAGIREASQRIGVAVRLSLFDFVPHVAGEGGIGRPATAAGYGPDGYGPGGYSYAFGGDGTGLGYDLTETHELLDLLAGLGVGIVCASAGSPYYVPHVQRPAFFPPSDGYQPPEDPLVGVARLIAATTEVAQCARDIRIVGAGLSYLQQWLPNVGQAMVASGCTDSVGLGRMMLSYPHMPADVLAGRPLDRRLLCRTFSDCTTAPRNGLVSGCYPLDDFYKQREERVLLAAAKKRSRTRLR